MSDDELTLRDALIELRDELVEIRVALRELRGVLVELAVDLAREGALSRLSRCGRGRLSLLSAAS